MKLSEQAMADINKLVDDIDDDKFNKSQIIVELLSIHGLIAVIDADGDKEIDI
jgi:hypothetical protein